MISHAEVRRQLRYEAETGEFWWIVGGTGRRLDRPAGRLDMGHRVIRLDGVDHHVSRLAWLYVRGEWPAEGTRVRFIDGNPLNCRIANLAAGGETNDGPSSPEAEAQAESDPRRMLTQGALKEMLDYRPDTGEFWWREFKHGRVMDQPAGSPWSNGCRAIRINGIDFMAQRLAWLYVHGEFPPPGRKVKPIDGDPLNTRIANLRLARTKQEHNAQYHKENPSANRRMLLSRYQGMSLDVFSDMLLAQNGLCAACQQPETVIGRHGKVRPLCVDHRHEDGAVRGLLCVGCNTALGYVKDDPARLRALADYIERHAAQQLRSA